MKLHVRAFGLSFGIVTSVLGLLPLIGAIITVETVGWDTVLSIGLTIISSFVMCLIHGMLWAWLNNKLVDRFNRKSVK